MAVESHLNTQKQWRLSLELDSQSFAEQDVYQVACVIREKRNRKSQ